MYNLPGQRVYYTENNQPNDNAYINLSDFKPGVYIIKLQTKNNTINKRIIVQ